MDEELSPDELEDMVLTWLSQQKANVLVEVCALIPLDCSEQIKGKRKSLLKHLLDHLCGLEDVTYRW